jgi:delta 1-pyrroline-5-carboxylate dehydrogenase
VPGLLRFDRLRAMRNAVGNFHINDTPTGAVVGQQRFGGARGSRTKTGREAS